MSEHTARDTTLSGLAREAIAARDTRLLELARAAIAAGHAVAEHYARDGDASRRPPKARRAFYATADELARLERVARDELLQTLRSEVRSPYETPPCLVLPDDTLVIVDEQADGLTIVPPERVWRIARDRRDGHEPAGELAREGE